MARGPVSTTRHSDGLQFVDQKKKDGLKFPSLFEIGLNNPL